MNLFKKMIVGTTLVGTLGCGQPQGYVGKCAEVAQTYQVRFENECTGKVDSTLRNGSLSQIVEEGHAALEQAGCKTGCEKWFCGRGNYAGPQGGEYGVRIEKTKICE